MLVTSVSCPKCGTSLAMPRPVPPGTPMDCPRCLLTFRAPQPGEGAEVLDDVEVVDEYKDDIPTVEAVEGSKPAGPAGPKRRPPPAYRLADGRPRFRARRRREISWVRVVAAAGSAVALLIALTALAVWLSTLGPGDEPLAFIPPDAQIVGGIRLGELADHVPAFAQLLDRFTVAPGGPSLKDEIGIDGRDLFDQVTFATTGESTQSTVVTKSRIPFDRKRITGRPPEGAKKVAAYGQSYFRIDDARSTIKCVYCPNNRILVFSGIAAEQNLRPILKSDGKKPTLTGLVGELAGKLSAHPIWIATTPDGLRTPVAGTPFAAEAMPGVDELARLAATVAAWASFENGALEVHFAATCGDETVAGLVVGKMQSEVPKFFAVLDAAGLVMPAWKPLAAELRSTARFSAQGPQAEMSARVNVATLEALVSELQRPAPKQP